MAVSYQDQLDDLYYRIERLEQDKDLHLEGILYKAVDESKRKVFADFGVDIDDPKQLQEFQQSLLFGRNIHKGVNKAIGGIFLFLCGAVGTAITIFISEWIKHGK